MNDVVSSQARSPSEAIAGKWRLLHGSADEGRVPLHRVDLVFHNEASGIRGAILNTLNSQEIPLASLEFDGSVLRLQMQAPEDKRRAEMPTLVMRAINDKFEGCWVKSGTEPLGPHVKIVRAVE
jgi:hypothetical protein